MNVELTPELEQLVQRKVDSGRYSSASQVVGQALRLLDQMDYSAPLSKDAVRERIEEGWQAAQRGEFVDGDEFFNRMDAELAAEELVARK